jgi:protein associated with RNAse G/E
MPFATWVCWDERFRHLGWYVNFQEPYTRLRRHVLYMDWMLDLQVSPDGQVRTRDLDELVAVVCAGLLPEQTLTRLLMHVDELTAEARDLRGRFAQEWISWRPPSTWQIPCLPDHWSDVGGGYNEI